MSRAKYIVILGLVCLCLSIAPAMAVSEACNKCTPEVMPAFMTDCPEACIVELGASFFAPAAQKEAFNLAAVQQIEGTDFSNPLDGINKANIPGKSKFQKSAEDFFPKLDIMVSKWSGHNVESDLKAQFIPFRDLPSGFNV